MCIKSTGQGAEFDSILKELGIACDQIRTGFGYYAMTSKIKEKHIYFRCTGLEQISENLTPCSLIINKSHYFKVVRRGSKAIANGLSVRSGIP